MGTLKWRCNSAEAAQTAIATAPEPSARLDPTQTMNSEARMHQHDYVREQWSARADGLMHAQERVLGWIFLILAGGLAGTLTYAASDKQINCALTMAALAFTFGLILILAYGALMFYIARNDFLSFKQWSDDFHKEKISFEELMQKISSQPDSSKIAELIVWLAAVCGITGMISLAVALI